MCNGILYSTEAWTNISDKEYERLEQVDLAVLRAIIGGGHSKCTKAFYYLEFGILMFRHIIMIKRLNYHHHIITRDDRELIKKVYQKQKDAPLIGDWVKLIQRDYDFIGEDWNDEIIRSIPKEDFTKLVNEKVQKAAFSSYLAMKEKSKTKMKYLKYDKFERQDYLSNKMFNRSEIKLLFALRSKCFSAKNNFKKMNKGSLQCIFKCAQIETQDHVFEHCEPILAKMNFKHKEKVENISYLY